MGQSFCDAQRLCCCCPHNCGLWQVWKLHYCQVTCVLHIGVLIVCCCTHLIWGRVCSSVEGIANAAIPLLPTVLTETVLKSVHSHDVCLPPSTTGFSSATNWCLRQECLGCGFNFPTTAKAAAKHILIRLLYSQKCLHLFTNLLLACTYCMCDGVDTGVRQMLYFMLHGSLNLCYARINDPYNNGAYILCHLYWW